ncbi:MAG: metalloregulator ArsR/SmtB family transcription factor [Candidatus Diapherotrites archaeon]
MPKKKDKIVKIFECLADKTRLSIIEFLIGGEKCVCEITSKIGRAQPTVSLQLAKLESAGILSSKRIGKKVFYQIKERSIYKILKAAGYKEPK